MQVDLPFEDSRRLTGPNLHFAGCGAVLEVAAPVDEAVIAGWASRIAVGRSWLRWEPAEIDVRRHPLGAILAIGAPVDQLFSATELNEWALLASMGCHALLAPGHPASWDDELARRTLVLLAEAERRPALVAVLEAARARGIPAVLDDDQLSIGLGKLGHSWPRDQPPRVEDVPWSALGGIPTALVTGSNGKTTTVRLIAGMLREGGRVVGHSCTDGVFIDGAERAAGDYSGPAGARSVLRDPAIDAAVLETARGGILRRGLAPADADVAVVTNVSADHFGEYGIHDLDGLVQVKLTVARALRAGGVLVLNADDERLRAAGLELGCQRAWFSLDAESPFLQARRAAGQACCAVADGRVRLWLAGAESDLGAAADLPLAAGGRARYNLANLAAASLAAALLGVGVNDIRALLSRFGAQPGDNPGRLERYSLGGIHILVDYAHNPAGLKGLLDIAVADRGEGRLALLLGQAGNRGDREIRDLAIVAAGYRPDLVVLKDIDGYIRGRAAGEVPALIRAELLRHGLAEDALPLRLSEMAAARTALEWARSGDTLVLPMHTLRVRSELAALLAELASSGWCAGQALPPRESTVA